MCVCVCVCNVATKLSGEPNCLLNFSILKVYVSGIYLALLSHKA